MKRHGIFKRSSYTVLLQGAWILFFLFTINTVFGQATTNISGIVNTYHRVVEIVPAKACLRVANTTGLNVNTPVIVIQMKGATINTSNSSAFGDTTGLNGAGHYEIGTICHIIGDSVFLFHQLLNSYDVSAKVQLVQFGEYYAANVVDTVKALSWDSTTGTGGVIAIYADQNITLNAPIYADSSGYAGGIWYNNSGTCNFLQQAGTGYVFDITASSNLNGAYKGESAAVISSTQNAGKGAPANGGGGGNNHNNSGAGGANLSAGGDGGGNSSNGPAGCNVGSNYGRAGKALSSWSGKKLFMGGGAGAGHANNGAAITNFGGNGGGIVFIWANNLIGNGHTISARGGRGGNSFGDGAGGGGAGGTIVMNVPNYTGSSTLAVTGGAGGDSFNDISIVRCFGGGGGGSGGAVYFSIPTPGAVTVLNSGGAGGQEFNRNAGCNPAVPGITGNNGSLIPNYTFSRSFTIMSYCLYLLPSKLIYFRAKPLDETIHLSWQMENPDLVQEFTIEKRSQGSDWISMASLSASGTRTHYSVVDRTPFSGVSFYRLRIVEHSQTVYYSETRRVSAGVALTDLTVYPNPGKSSVTISGNFAPNSLLQVIDIGGRIAWQKIIASPQSVINLPPLPAGLYLVRCKETVKKLVIY